MDDDFILEKLKKWVPLFYGKEAIPRSFKSKNFYCFGPKEDSNERLNRLTKPVALFLVFGHVSFVKYLKENDIQITEIDQPLKKQKRCRRK